MDYRCFDGFARLSNQIMIRWLNSVKDVTLMPNFNHQKIRNVAIIAHVDHGKTTLVDALLKQTQALDKKVLDTRCVMDSNDLERERGITILAKNTAIVWEGYRINIVDTPGHADFGGEVERILSMVDAVILLVDAVEGPMPQTRFVTEKAFKHGLKPIVVINKIDRPEIRIIEVQDEIFELFDQLGADDHQLDFTTLYASGVQGYAMLDPKDQPQDMTPLLKTIIDQVPCPEVEPNGPFQCQISALDYSSYVGVIGIGRLQRGSARANQQVVVIDAQGQQRKGKILEVMHTLGMARQVIDEAHAGDIIAITGIDALNISDTLCDPDALQALPALEVDQPTVEILMRINDSPFAGKEGKYLTSRHISERLERELIANVALRVKPTDDPNAFLLAGRGELHLSILIETMRREGYECAVGRPAVIEQYVEGSRCEPYEQLIVDIDKQYQSAGVDLFQQRGGQLSDIDMNHGDRCRLTFEIPTRGLMGMRSQFLSISGGDGIMHHRFMRYGPWVDRIDAPRHAGVLIANCAGKALAYALHQLQARGRMLISPGCEVYEGMVVGIHSRSNDLVVNVTRAKQLTNIRAAGSDENIVLTPPVEMSLEALLTFINDDEWLEITPQHLRIRKQKLKAHQRK